MPTVLGYKWMISFSLWSHSLIYSILFYKHIIIQHIFFLFLSIVNGTKPCPVGPPKTDGSWSLTECGPLEKGMANHFSILALRTPWTVWEGKMIGNWKRNCGWMASPTHWTWVWVDSGRWWWTGRPGVLRFTGSQRVGHTWAAELNWIVDLVSPGGSAVKNPPA